MGYIPVPQDQRRKRQAIVRLPSAVADLAYMAGIIDGEGCIRIQLARGKGGRANGHTLEMNVANTDEGLMVWILDTFGGLCRVKMHGRITGLMRRPCWVWWITGKHVGMVLEAVLPYLRVKRAQADLAMRFLAHEGGRQFVKGRRPRLHPDFVAEREAMKVQMHLLKQPAAAQGGRS